MIRTCPYVILASGGGGHGIPPLPVVTWPWLRVVENSHKSVFPRGEGRYGMHMIFITMQGEGIAPSISLVKAMETRKGSYGLGETIYTTENSNISEKGK